VKYLIYLFLLGFILSACENERVGSNGSSVTETLPLATSSPEDEGKDPSQLASEDPFLQEVLPEGDPESPLAGDGKEENEPSPAAAAAGAFQYHVVGVYDGGAPQDTVLVTLRRTEEPVDLVLSSYNAVRWKLILLKNARLRRVVVQGHDVDRSTVTFLTKRPRNIVVTKRPWSEAKAAAYAWEPNRVEDQGPGTNFVQMIESLRGFYGSKKETSFQGCYGGIHFLVPYNQLSLLSLRSCGASGHRKSYY
jgi:hypothetical protein